jgi:hypothetical protein
VPEYFPETFDFARLLDHAVGAMVQLSNTGTEMSRLRAAKWLLEYADAGIATRSGSPGREREGIIADLRNLYRKALRPEE